VKEGGKTWYCPHGGDAGCWFLDTGFLKVIILILSSIKHPVSSIFSIMAQMFVFTI
jgi:hypothetical protein